jgi:hypothetical protein
MQISEITSKKVSLRMFCYVVVYANMMEQHRRAGESEKLNMITLYTARNLFFSHSKSPRLLHATLFGISPLAGAKFRFSQHKQEISDSAMQPEKFT